MEQTLEYYDFGLKDANLEIENVSSQTDNLRKHLKTHIGEKSNKCSQCDFASSQAGNLRTHLKKTQWRKISQMQPM